MRSKFDFNRAVKSMLKPIPAKKVERMIKDALDEASGKKTVLLATVPSSKKGTKPYEIKFGANNTVWCTCNGFKYRNECRHMRRLRDEWKVVTFK